MHDSVNEGDEGIVVAIADPVFNQWFTLGGTVKKRIYVWEGDNRMVCYGEGWDVLVITKKEIEGHTQNERDTFYMLYPQMQGKLDEI